jgi:probable HAF family extracellular repeat protein
MRKFLLTAVVLSTVSLACLSTAFALPGIAFTDLGPVNDPGNIHSYYTVPWAINGSGQITGYAQIGSGSIDPGHTAAFLYSGGTMTDLQLGGLNGQSTLQSYGYGINNSGTVVGIATNTALNSTRAMVTSGGLMTSIDDSDPTIGQSRAYGVNSSGTVVGAAYWTLNQFHPVIYTYSGTYNPTTAVYSGGTWSFADIDGILGGTGLGLAIAINDAGTVTGSAPYTDGNGHAFVRTSAGVVTDLGTFGGSSSRGFGINAHGDVAGNANAADGQPHAFLAVNGPSGYGALTDLGIPTGFVYSNGMGINKYDIVSGQAYNGSASHAFLWTTGVVPFYGLSVGANDLNIVAASALPSGWVLNTARSINDAGQIAVSASYGGNFHACMITLPQAVPGDANLDGVVDINDLGKVLTNYDKTGMTWSDGDFDGSGTVDIQDLGKVLTNYDKTASAAVGIRAVPEPGTLALLAAGLALLVCAGRKRK